MVDLTESIQVKIEVERTFDDKRRQRRDRRFADMPVSELRIVFGITEDRRREDRRRAKR